MENNSAPKAKQQWKKRIDVFRYIYTTIIDNIGVQDIKSKAYTEYDFGADQMRVIEYYADNIETIQQLITSKLNPTWPWARVKPILKAILFSAYSESKTLGIDKKIIIDQAIVTTKKYSELNDYRFINAILDKIIE